MTEPTHCPRCKTSIEGKTVTVSRKDGETRICGSCGVREGRWIFENPDSELPDLNNPIPFTFDGT